MSEMKWGHYILLAIILITGFMTIFNIHYSYDEEYIDPHSSRFYIEEQGTSYPYPFHADEWAHLGLSMNIMEQGRISHINPYHNATAYNGLESGFHAFIAAFFVITGLDPITTYQYLPALFFMIAMAALFLMMFVMTKNVYIALMAPLFMMLIRNNINILGFWFFVPMTASLFLIFMFFASYLSNGRIRALSIIFLIASIFIYPLSTIIIVITTAIIELINFMFDKEKKIIHKIKKYKYYVLAAAILGTAGIIIFREKLLGISWIFKYGWTELFEHTYMPWELYGLLAFILAVIGLIYSIIKIKRLLPIMILFITTLITMLMYIFLRFTILIPYQRGLFYFMITLAILSSLGTYYLYILIRKIIYKINYDKELSKKIAFIIITIIFITSIITGFTNYYKVEDKTFDLVQYATQKDVDAMRWIKENYPKGTIMMTDIFVSYTVYPLSGMQVVAIPASNVKAGNIDSVQRFYYNNYYSDCNSRINILKQENARLVYIHNPINCPSLKEVYKKGVYVYELI